MSLNTYERTMLRTVAEHGWQCTKVFDPDGNQPDLAYSVGLWESICAPELIVFGLDIDLMHEMLWVIYRRLKSGVLLSDGARWPGVLEGFECVSRPVHPSQLKIEYFNSALWYREYQTGDRMLQAYQIFWPGAENGLFPWEAGAETVRELQPLLYLPNERGLA
jgi:hypothetical protein